MIKENILPLAITQVDLTFACVAGITDQNEWIRPKPVYVSDIESQIFKYAHVTEIHCNSLNDRTLRREDKAIFRENLSDPNIQQDNNVRLRINKILDQSLDSIFMSDRTVGIIKIKIKDITYGKSLGGKKNFRIIFNDLSKERNLIIGDYFLKQELKDSMKKSL